MLKRKTRTARDLRIEKLEKEREQRRKTMVKTRFGRKKQKHARKGVQSCIYAMMCVGMLFCLLLLSFLFKGQLGVFAGFVCLVILWLGVTGIRTGIRGLNERDKNYMTCRVGIVINAVVLFGIAYVFIRGLM